MPGRDGHKRGDLVVLRLGCFTTEDIEDTEVGKLKGSELRSGSPFFLVCLCVLCVLCG
jgi:hypothetical protein